MTLPKQLGDNMTHGILIEGLKKRFGQGDNAFYALKDVNMQVAPGEVVGLIGPSGSGKSTLLKCLGAVIDPTEGRMTLGDEVIFDQRWLVKDLSALRRDKIGFMFQTPYLIPFLNVLDNVALLPMLAGVANDTARARALEILTALDVQHRVHAMPGQLSGGEQQRVAIARALVRSPRLVLADEPTGNLDTHASDSIFALLRRFNRERGTGFLIVTHDPSLAARCDRIVELVDGRIADDRPNQAL